MCGIAGLWGEAPMARVNQMLDIQKHRGPDGRDILYQPIHNFAMGHDRLAIIDVEGGKQPIPNEDETLWVIVNGEIYNHKELRKNLLGHHQFRTKSDSEVVLHLFEDIGEDCIRKLDGMFAFAIWGFKIGLFLGRDPVGIKPFYFGFDGDHTLYFSSEIKGIINYVTEVKELPNGCYLRVNTPTGSDLHPVRYYSIPAPQPHIFDPETAILAVDRVLHSAVKKRLMADVPLGVFLSGGLDSSLISAIARIYTKGELHSFAVGLANSADILAARVAAEAIGTIHHELILTPYDIFNALPTVIWHLESYDPALVRSAIPTYFVSRLTAERVKVVLSGEGADELFAGYQYLNDFAMNAEALDEELHLITTQLHNLNLQRVDRMTMAHGLEGRVPFLDTQMIDLAFQIDPHLKWREQGKWILRKVAEKYLPSDIAWREKEKFAIGTGIGPLLEEYTKFEAKRAEQEDSSIQETIAKFTSPEEWFYWKKFKIFFPLQKIVREMGHSRSLNPTQRWVSAL